MSLAIDGLATVVPPDSFPQDVILAAVKTLCRTTPEQAGLLEWIFSQAGVNKRHYAVGQALMRDVLAGTRLSESPFLPECSHHAPRDDQRGPTTAQRMQEYARHAGPLAMTAARQALHNARVAAEQITHLVTISCTGFQAPGVDIQLIQGLHLPATTERVHVGFMGCHAAINGLRVAQGLIAAAPQARVLVCSVELSSMHGVYEWNLEQMVASALFSDGAGALVASAALTPSAWQLAATGSCVFADSSDAMSWTVGDHGFAMTLSAKVPSLIARNLPAWLRGWLGQHGLSIGDVPTWCVHPGGPRILSAVVEGLGLDSSAVQVSRDILAEYGNMSSATILFILERLMRQQAPRPCVALAFGPGLTAEAALFR